MAKKEFKKGLDSLLESTIKQHKATKSAEQVPKENVQTENVPANAATQPETTAAVVSENDAALKSEILALQFELQQVKRELFLWRNGTLTEAGFKETLAQTGLVYDPSTNQIQRA